MKRNEFLTGLCLLACLLTALFAGSLWPILNEPIYPRIEALLHSSPGRSFFISTPPHRTSLRGEPPRI